MSRRRSVEFVPRGKSTIKLEHVQPREVASEPPVLLNRRYSAPVTVPVIDGRGMNPQVTPVDTSHVKIVAVVVTKRPWLADHVGRMLAWQTLRPIRIVVCTAVPSYDDEPIRRHNPGTKIEVVTAGKDLVLGQLRNVAMDAAAHGSPDEALLCTLDDDDCYGTRYFEGIGDAWCRHPFALVIGLGSWDTQTVDRPPHTPLHQSGRPRGGPLSGVAGATLSIPAKIWRERTDLRYPAVAVGEDIELLTIARRENRVVGAYFGDFVALRYSDPRHDHSSPNQGLLPQTGRRL